jgi:hypothetical protein
MTLTPRGDTLQGVFCMGGGLLGAGAGFSGLYMAPQAAAQTAALGVIVVSMLVCEFAFNALWDPTKSR